MPKDSCVQHGTYMHQGGDETCRAITAAENAERAQKEQVLEELVFATIHEAHEKSEIEFPDGYAHPKILDGLRRGFVNGYMRAWTVAQNEKKENAS